MKQERHDDAYSRLAEFPNRLRRLATCAASKQQRTRSTASVARLREYRLKDSPLLLLANPKEAQQGFSFSVLGLGRDDFDDIFAKHIRTGYLPLGVLGQGLELGIVDDVVPPKYRGDFTEFAKAVAVAILHLAAAGKFCPEIEWHLPDGVKGGGVQNSSNAGASRKSRYVN